MFGSFCNYLYKFECSPVLNLIIYKIEEITDIPLLRFFKDILGVKLLKEEYAKYVLNTKKPEVLIIEPNSLSHGETLLSVWNYFKKFNYKADFILSPEIYGEGALEQIKTKARIFALPVPTISNLIEKGLLGQYKIVFFNSYNTYFGQYDLKKDIIPTIFDYYKIPKCDTKFMGYLHHLNYADDCKEHGFKYFSLADLNQQYANQNTVLNPHYFGKVKITPKNEHTNFIVVGNITALRRNLRLLTDSVKKLVDNGITDFKVTIAGRIFGGTIPDEIKSYFTTTGRVSYPKIKELMEESDFFIPLLDPNNPEHDRYITTGTSGSFQLIYGFLKPCLIHEKFSSLHLFNNENSIIYSNNDELYDKMVYAINMKNKEYTRLQDNLRKVSDKLYNKSLENLKKSI